MRDELKSREELLDELEALRARNLLLEELVVEPTQRDVKTFLAHKIRNLLTSTLGYASYLEDETEALLNEEQRGYLKRIGHSVDLMINLVNELVEQAEKQDTTFAAEIGLRH